MSNNQIDVEISGMNNINNNINKKSIGNINSSNS